MDIDNETLKQLMKNTDKAFEALMQNPDSSQLTDEYNEAKEALDCYLADMRSTLEKRYKF